MKAKRPLTPGEIEQAIRDAYVDHCEKNGYNTSFRDFKAGYTACLSSSLPMEVVEKMADAGEATNIILANCMRYPDTVGKPVVKFLLSRGIGKEVPSESLLQLMKDAINNEIGSYFKNLGAEKAAQACAAIAQSRIEGLSKEKEELKELLKVMVTTNFELYNIIAKYVTNDQLSGIEKDITQSVYNAFTSKEQSDDE